MSALHDEIKKAIAAHGLWKMRLKSAIEHGTFDQTVERVSRDDACEFGKWLYGPSIPPAQKNAHFETCRKLHAEFHRTTGSVLEQALAGHKDRARNAMAVDSKFATASTALTQAMMAWMADSG